MVTEFIKDINAQTAGFIVENVYELADFIQSEYESSHNALYIIEKPSTVKSTEIFESVMKLMMSKNYHKYEFINYEAFLKNSELELLQKLLSDENKDNYFVFARFDADLLPLADIFLSDTTQSDVSIFSILQRYPGVLFLERTTIASINVRTALYKLLYNKQIGNILLHPGVMIVSLVDNDKEKVITIFKINNDPPFSISKPEKPKRPDTPSSPVFAYAIQDYAIQEQEENKLQNEYCVKQVYLDRNWKKRKR